MTAPNFRCADIKHCQNCMFSYWSQEDETFFCIQHDGYAPDGMICDDYEEEVTQSGNVEI